MCNLSAKIPGFFENEAQALDTMSPETGDLRIVAHRVKLPMPLGNDLILSFQFLLVKLPLALAGSGLPPSFRTGLR